MLKEKWKKLLLRKKILLISGILVIFSFPLSLITLYSMAISMTFFVTTVFYNLYKFMQISNVTISEAIETDIQKGKTELRESKKGFWSSKDNSITFGNRYGYTYGIYTIDILMDSNITRKQIC